MALTPIKRFLTAECSIFSLIENVKEDEINFNNKIYSEVSTTIACRFDTVNRRIYEGQTEDVSTIVGKFFMSDNEIKINDRINFNDKTFRVKDIIKHYDYPNANQVHHLEIMVEDGRDNVKQS